jgi:heme A synthase
MSRLARFAWAVLSGNVLVILWGAFVRATGSGAGCGGHWPTCNGEVIPRAPATATLIELSHRASSGLAFFLVLGLGGLVLYRTPREHPARVAAVLAMALMLTEVLIGAAIVLLGHVALDPSIVHGVFTELHAGNTFFLLAALTLTAHFLSGERPPEQTTAAPPALSLAPPASWRLSPRLPLAQAFLAIAFTVGSGAIAALGDTLFPARTLGEGLAADVSPGAHLFLHLRTLHPLFALVAFVVVLSACSSIRGLDGVSPRCRSLAGWAMVATCAQMALGLLNLWLLVPIATQMLHLLLADVLFVLLVLTAANALGQEKPPAEAWQKRSTVPAL